VTILAVDTTGNALSVALKVNGKVYSVHKVFKQPHDETLIKQVDLLLKKAKISVEDLDVVAAASGPGRFTGIRIGMAYAAVAAGTLGKKALAVSRLEALALRSKAPLVAAVAPGFRDEKFYQVFEREAAEPPVWIDAAGWPAARAALVARGAELVEADPTAVDVLAAAEDILESGEENKFEPLYLKPAGYEAKRQTGARS
jgi:tRNA threonylcarbamoyl adenosine modification protein YeaZ